MDPGATSRHYRLRTTLIQKIASGQWRAHQAIPSERELEKLFGVSRATTRRAIDDLVSAGYVYREQGRGTFVAPVRERPARAELLGFVEELQRGGVPVAVRLLELRTATAPPAVAEHLRLAPDDPVIILRRLVTSQGVPLLLADSYLPEQLGGPRLYGLLAQETPIYRALELAGISIARGQQRLRAMLLDKAAAALLGAEPGDPGLELVRVTYSLEDTPIEYSRGVYHGDRYQYVIDLTRGERSAVMPT